MTVRRQVAVIAAVLVLGAAGCEPLFAPDHEPSAPAAPTSPASPTSPTSPVSPGRPATKVPTVSPSATPTSAPALGTVPPAWLGTRVLPEDADGFGQIQPTPRELRNRRFTLPDTVPRLPGTGFESDIVAPPPADVLARSTWQSGCPVRAEQLAWVRLTFHGFDGRRHTGELLLNRSVAGDVVTVFAKLWDQRFPLEEMRVTRRDELDAPPTGDGNNTSAFVCRPAVGSTRFSEHAYGLAVDVNPFQNPYTKGDLVLPELASSYLDRGWKRPGMLTPDAIGAFASIGWGWGGNWHSLKDRHHFSLHNR